VGARVAVVAILLAAAGGMALIVRGATSGDGHRLRAAFDSVVQVTDGQEVRIAGRKVGEVDAVRLEDGHPIVDLRIDDEAWPLPRGTSARIRWGSTTSYLSRYVELLPGREGEPPLADDAMLSRAQTTTPFELDQAYRIFRGRTKADAARLLGGLGDTLGPRPRALRRGLRATPGGLDETGAFMRELAADEAALRTLVVAGDRTTSAIAAREDDLRGLMTNAAGTFDELAEHARDQQDALDRAPRAFAESTRTLARLDTTLEGLDGLVGDLRPASPALRRLARSSRTALARVRAVMPLAAATLRSATAAAPSLERLFASGTQRLPRLAGVLADLTPMLSCLRPYAPELGGFLSTWSGFSKNYDANGHYARSFPLEVVPAIAPGTSNTSKQVTERQRGLRYAMPRPPGLNAGKPWFQPQCGAGPEALDPSKDPEGEGR